MDNLAAKFCHDVCLEPLSFFSESDLQGVLFERLNKAYPSLVSTGVRRGPGSKSFFKTPQVHREYGAGEGRRIDLVVLPKAELKRCDRNLTLKGKYIAPDFIFELGTEKSIDAAAHMENDVDKCGLATKTGYLIHFLRDTTKAATGSRGRAKTEAKIDRTFRKHVERFYRNAIPKHVKSLFFILKIARAKRKIWSRCELYNPNDAIWMKVNTKSVGAVSKALLRT